MVQVLDTPPLISFGSHPLLVRRCGNCLTATLRKLTCQDFHDRPSLPSPSLRTTSRSSQVSLARNFRTRFSKIKDVTMQVHQTCAQIESRRYLVAFCICVTGRVTDQPGRTDASSRINRLKHIDEIG